MKKATVELLESPFLIERVHKGQRL